MGGSFVAVRLAEKSNDIPSMRARRASSLAGQLTSPNRSVARPQTRLGCRRLLNAPPQGNVEGEPGPDPVLVSARGATYAASPVAALQLPIIRGCDGRPGGRDPPDWPEQRRQVHAS